MSRYCRFFVPPPRSDDLLTIFAEINPVARTEIEPVFEHPRAHSLDVAKITLLQTNDGYGHSGSCRGVQFEKPLRVRTFPVCVYVLFGDGQAAPARSGIFISTMVP